jgi:hypothetical protein
MHPRTRDDFDLDAFNDRLTLIPMEYHVAEVPVESALSDIAEMLARVIREKRLVLDGPRCETTAVALADHEPAARTKAWLAGGNAVSLKRAHGLRRR